MGKTAASKKPASKKREKGQPPDTADLIPQAGELLALVTASELDSIDAGSFDDLRKQLTLASKATVKKGNISLSSMMDRTADKMRVVSDVVKSAQLLLGGGHMKDTKEFSKQATAIQSYHDER